MISAEYAAPVRWTTSRPRASGPNRRFAFQRPASSSAGASAAMPAAAGTIDKTTRQVRIRNDSIFVRLRSVPHGRKDPAAQDLARPTAPDAALPIIPAGKNGHQFNFGDHDEDLAAIAGRRIGAIGALAGTDLAEVPGIGVVRLAVELRELFRAEPRGRRRDVHPRRGGLRHPGPADDPPSPPHAAVEVGLSDLQQVPRPQPGAA